MRLIRLIGFAVFIATSCCFAQDSGDFKPATSNVLDAQYPRVDGNSRVQVRFKAPEAAKVRANFWSGPKADMQKQADGFWTFITPPMAPGLHYYTVIVDGAEVSDPGSTAYFGGSKWASAVEVPEAGATYNPCRGWRRSLRRGRAQGVGRPGCWSRSEKQVLKNVWQQRLRSV
jgi:hypothetical protein